jgi:CHAT domain
VLASFWAGVGGKLADRWASAGVPALIFWLGGLLAYAYHRNGISPITRSLARWTTPEQVAALVVALLVVGASAIVVQRLTLPWLRLLEGYWPSWCGPVRERMADRAWQQSVADEAAAQQLARFVYGADPTAAQLAQFARLEDRRHRRPEEQNRFMPTDHGSRPLTVLDVIRLRLGGAEFAYLSACSTARTGAQLPDEAIHLAAAFHLAGYRHVIGTLWPAGDRAALAFAADMYPVLLADGDASQAASTLHDTVLTLRLIHAPRPSVWAGHIHLGG